MSAFFGWADCGAAPEITARVDHDLREVKRNFEMFFETLYGVDPTGKFFAAAEATEYIDSWSST